MSNKADGRTRREKGMLEWRINSREVERGCQKERDRVGRAGVGSLRWRTLKELVFASLFRFSLGFCLTVTVLGVLFFFFFLNLFLHRRIQYRK